jgi:hypothetical protein
VACLSDIDISEEGMFEAVEQGARKKGLAIDLRRIVAHAPLNLPQVVLGLIRLIAGCGATVDLILEIGAGTKEK